MEESRSRRQRTYFHVDGLSPATTYCYVPYVLYQGIYHKGEKISFTTLPEEDIDIELSKEE